MARVFIGLGTNMGDRRANISRAIKELEKLDLVIRQTAPVLETAPVDYLEQDHFFNTICEIETELPPQRLLEALQQIELAMGRVKLIPKGPRIIDLDILLYDDLILNEKVLTLPHPGIKERWFVLDHLIELDAELVDPLTGRTYRAIKSQG